MTLRQMLFNTRSMFSRGLARFSTKSDPYLGFSNIACIKDKRDFLEKITSDGLTAVFFFGRLSIHTCNIFAPTVAELRWKFPHVTIYETIGDKESFRKYGVKDTTVPVFFFYKNGKFVTEVIGLDATRVEERFEKLYSVLEGQNEDIYYSQGSPDKMTASRLPIFHGCITEKKKHSSNVSYLLFHTSTYNQLHFFECGVSKYMLQILHTIHISEHVRLVITSRVSYVLGRWLEAQKSRDDCLARVKFILRQLCHCVYQAREKLGKDGHLVFSVDTILIVDGHIKLPFPMKIQSGLNKNLESLVAEDLAQMHDVIDWILKHSGICMGSVDIYELKNMFMFAENDNRFLKITLQGPALNDSIGRNRMRCWAWSKFKESGVMFGTDKEPTKLARLVAGRIYTKRRISKNYNWKHNLRGVLGDVKYRYWTGQVDGFDHQFAECDVLAYLRFSRIFVVHTKDQLGLSDEEVDRVLSEAFPCFLHFLFEVIYSLMQWPVEFNSTWNFKDLRLSMGPEEYDL